MSRLLQVLLTLSVVVAVVLWAALAWLQGSMVSPPAAESRDLSFGEVAKDSRLNTAQNKAACDVVEEEMRELVVQSRSCSEDADCAVFDYGYPIECLTSVARAQIPMLRREFERYHESCDFRVYYDCPTGEASRRPACREQKCEIELTSVDSLRDATLDYLEKSQ